PSLATVSVNSAVDGGAGTRAIPRASVRVSTEGRVAYGSTATTASASGSPPAPITSTTNVGSRIRATTSPRSTGDRTTISGSRNRSSSERSSTPAANTSRHGRKNLPSSSVATTD